MNGSRQVSEKPLSVRRLVYLFGMLLLPSLIGVGAALILRGMPYASLVTLKLTVSRFAFELESASLRNELLRSLTVNSVAMSNVQAIAFSAHRVRLADPRLYNAKQDTYPKEAWKQIAGDQPMVVFQAKSPPSLPFVRFLPVPPGVLTLDPIRVKPRSRVVLELPEDNHKDPQGAGSTQSPADRNPIELKATVELQEGTFNVAAQGPVQMRTRELGIEGSSLYSPNQPATFAVDLDHKNLDFRIVPRHGPLDLLFEPISDLGASLLPTGFLQLSRPEFLRPIPNATPLDSPDSASYTSSLLEQGTNDIVYAGLPETAVRPISPHALLYFSDDTIFTLTALSISRSTGAIQIELQGRPHYIYSISKSSGRQDYQMTLLDYLMGNKPVQSVFIIGTWLATTTVAIYKFVKEIRK